MLRIGEDFLCHPKLDDLAKIHHRDPVTDHADNRKIMADEHIGQIELLLQV